MLLVGLLFFPVRALSDGGFVGTAAFEKIQIPDQRALIHFADGKETLVIDTGFKGTGTNFAWLIPVPSVPSIEPATPGLFSTLRFLLQPHIVHDTLALYWFEGFVGLLIIGFLWERQRKRSLIEILAIVGIVVIFSGMLLPALGTASFNASSGQVSVVERKRVGVYETATLVSKDGQAVFDWLKQNGFVVRTNFIPAIRAYAQEGWCFVASKVRTDAAAPDAANVHPLALTFASPRPVYPLRLTGIDNPSCRIELYVFGSRRAEVPGFTVERCGFLAYPSPSEPAARRLDGLRIRQPLLRRLVEKSPAATKLAASLTPRDMTQDAYVNWTPIGEERLIRYSFRGAAVIAANYAVPVLMLGLLGYLVTNLIRKKELVWSVHMAKVVGIVILAALVCWGSIFICLPKTKVVVSSLPAVRLRQLHSQTIPIELARLMVDEGIGESGKRKPDVGWLHRQLVPTSDWRRTLPTSFQKNLLTGEPWREEDSPGNCTIRETPAGIDYVWYDLEGGENIVPLFPRARPGEDLFESAGRL